MAGSSDNLRTNGQSLALRVPPQSLDMERALLGALLADGRALARVSDLIDESSFYHPVHGLVYGAMLSLDARREPVDTLTLTEELKRKGKFEEIGGLIFVTELIETMPSAANVEYYARMVHEKALLRRMISIGNRTVSEAYEASARADDLVEAFQTELVKLLQERRGRHAVRMDAILRETFKHIENIKKQDHFLTGVGSGFDWLDEYTTGFGPGEFIIIAARPSMGKTALALNIAQHASELHNCRVAVFSLEMDVRQLVLRILSSESHIDLHKLRSAAPLTTDEYSRLSEAVGRLYELQLFFDDSAGLSIEHLRARARQLWIEQDIGLIIVDYLQLIQPPRVVDNQQQWIAHVSASLKSLAKELRLPIICVSQLSREPEKRGGDRRPMLSDLRDSGAIEQDADIVMFVYRPEMYKDFIKAKKYEIAGQSFPIEGIAEIIIAKNRNGPTGSFPLTFVKRYTMFSTVARDEPPPMDDGGGSTESDDAGGDYGGGDPDRVF